MTRRSRGVSLPAVNLTPTTRRDFVRTTAASLVLLPLATLAGATAKETVRSLNVVCVGAHPDDPESGCGGTLRKFSLAGHTVTALYLTRGEAGIEGRSPAEAATLRTAEAERACAVLGVRPMFFGQIDGATVVDRTAVKAMERTLADLRPDIVFAHWPIDAHQDHQVASVLTIQARLRAKRPWETYFYEVCAGEQSRLFRPTDYVDITAVQAVKRAAVFCHASQNPAAIYGEGRHDLMETFRGAECGAAAAEAFVRLTGGGAGQVV